MITIEIAKPYLSFSAGHFTLFSATERENLHGHNWRLACAATARVNDGGLCFDYARLKTAMRRLCAELDECVLLPGRSPWLHIVETDGRVEAQFNGEVIPFLARDVLILPVANVTVEELCGLFLQRLRDAEELRGESLQKLRVSVSSGADQWGHIHWRAG